MSQSGGSGSDVAPITFYYASGSPFSWKVWLALEHKKLAYVPWQLSFDAGDLRAPGYANINPRRKVPVIVDDGFTLYESAAIIDYLEDRHAASGGPLWPREVRQRALARRVAAEADAYVHPQVNTLVVQLLSPGAGGTDASLVAAARARLALELELITPAVAGPFIAGAMPSAADYALYPLLALLGRIDARLPGQDLQSMIPERLRAWMANVAALPYFARTYPPHWKA